MKKIIEDRERTWYKVKEFTTKSGLKAVINQCVWKRNLPKGFEHLMDSLTDHYCGYVQIPKACTTKLYDNPDIDVHGGVTFEGELIGQKGKGNWVGFDMAHLFDEKIPNPLEYAQEQCELLADQVVKL